MVFVDNYITNFINTNRCYVILAFFDWDKALDQDFLVFFLKRVIEKNRILTKIIKNNSWVYCDTTFELSNHYKVINTTLSKFQSYTNKVLNQPLYQLCRWNCTMLRDPIANKSRLYFKIDHSYCDGYKLMHMLTTALYPNYKNPSFKRKWLSITSVPDYL